MKRTARSVLLATLLVLVPAWAPVTEWIPAPSSLAAQEPADTTRTSQQKDRSSDPLPLEPGRTVSYDLTEGTWMSVDVSPDGETVLFDLMGDLFTVPLAGGEATQLTSGMAMDAQPRYSPDGSWIVFTSDRSGGQNIWAVRTDGTDTLQISKGKANRAESPEWTPDGDYVVAAMGGFRGGGLPKLHLYHIDGGRGVKLVEEPERMKTLGPAFGADDRYVWFARRNGDWDYNAQLPQYQLAVYDRETGEIYGKTSRYGSAFRPTLSPDGRWLVYGTRHEDETGLVLREIETGEERWLAYPVQHDDQESRATMDVLPGMSFTPDSRWLVASWDGKLWKIPVEGGREEEIPFRARFDQPVGPEVDFDYPIEDTPTFTVRQIRNPVPSPDGTRLAFTAMDRLWVSDIDGTDPERVTDTDHSEHFPAWSPDGRWLAYATWEGDAGHLYKTRADGSGDPVRLSGTGAVYAQPAWSPSGERVVAMRGQARVYEEAEMFGGLGQALEELVWFPAAGGRAMVVMPAGDRAAPHFRVDRPDRIYLFGGGDGLVSVRWDGTDEREHVKVRGVQPAGSSQGLGADLIVMAPRGDQALARIEHHVYTVTVPRVGAEAPTISVAKPDNAQFPARKVTEMGGEFPAWSADGRSVHFSLGNAFFTYDLDAARAHEDSVEAAAEAEAEEEEGVGEEGEGEGAGEEGEQGEEEEQAEPDDEDEGYRAAEVRVVVEAERDIPEGVAVLRGGRIVTMRGDEVIENGDLVVRNNRIVAVGPSGEVEVPDGAEIIDVSGTTLVPGFVDTHSHMWPTWGLHREDQWMYLANLAYGVTTTRDPQTSRSDVLSYADMVRSGEVLGPRIYSTGPGVFWQEDIQSLDHARDVLGRYSRYFDTKTIKMYVAGNRQQRQWIIQAAREERIMPTTEGSLNYKQNIAETLDGYPGLEHSLPIYPVHDDVVQLFAEVGRTYTPTLLVSYGGPWAENFFHENENIHDDPKVRRFTPHEAVDAMSRRRGQWFLPEEYVFEDHACFVKDLVEAGGKAGVGSHGGGDLRLQGIGYHWELWAMAACDMDPHDALEVATVHGARAIGLDTDLGSLEPGKLADLVVLDANPLDDLRATNRIRYVMKNGRLYQGDTLDEVFPEERALAPLWWWDEDPVVEELPGTGGG